MYPTLIKIGSFEITTFGLMMFAAFIVGGWVTMKIVSPILAIFLTLLLHG